MLPVKRILCPTDFSEDSRAAVTAAGELAQYFQAHLTVLHVHAPPIPTVWPYEGLGVGPVDPMPNEEVSLAQRETELAAEARAALPAGLNVELLVLPGDPAAVIVETAGTSHADMIVLAPHGHGRLRKAIFGSTAEEVVRNAPCPVVTMHPGESGAQPAGGTGSEKTREGRA